MIMEFMENLYNNLLNLMSTGSFGFKSKSKPKPDHPYTITELFQFYEDFEDGGLLKNDKLNGVFVYRSVRIPKLDKINLSLFFFKKENDKFTLEIDTFETFKLSNFNLQVLVEEILKTESLEDFFEDDDSTEE